jgi:hypothetical protein
MGGSIALGRNKSEDRFLVHNRLGAMPDSKYKPPYAFSVAIGEYCARQMQLPGFSRQAEDARA